MNAELMRCDEEGVPLLVQEVRLVHNVRYTARLFNGCIVNCYMRPHEFMKVEAIKQLSDVAVFMIVSNYVADNYIRLMKQCVEYGRFHENHRIFDAVQFLKETSKCPSRLFSDQVLCKPSL